MRRPRCNHSSKFKAKVALAALKGDKTLAELASQIDVYWLFTTIAVRFDDSNFGTVTFYQPELQI